MTCQKGKAWLSENQIPFNYRHIEKEALSPAELKEIAARKGMAVKDLINPKSTTLKKLAVSVADLSEAEVLDLIAKHPKALHRPIVITDDQILLGFKADQFAALLS